MSISRKRKIQIEQRQRQVAELTLKGLAQSEIAARLGISQSTVSNDLKAIRAAWRQGALRDFDATFSEQLEMLTLIQREAWEAWERSKQPGHTAVIAGAGEGEPSKTRQTIKRQTGDPRFLEQLQKCLAASRALLGLAIEGDRRAKIRLSEKNVFTIAGIV